MRGIWSRFMDGCDKAGRDRRVGSEGREMYGCGCLSRVEEGNEGKSGQGLWMFQR